jgi:Cyclohydrolase (MCH)
MDLTLNRRALELADAMAAEAEGLRIRVTRLGNGTRLLDCGVEAEGGLEAGRRDRSPGLLRDGVGTGPGRGPGRARAVR